EIFTWDYVMEQSAKKEWEKNHPNEPNPYEGLAQLNIYTYNLGDVFQNNPEYVKKSDDDYFNFSEFFRTFKGKKDEDGIELPPNAAIGHFIHENDVIAFLDLLCQRDTESRYPYSNDTFCNALSHTLWMLPGVAQAARLATLIHQHKLHTEFGFEVVNVAGEGNAIDFADPDDITKIEKKEKDALQKVQNAIKAHKRTITLSCGRLTTGVSIPEWTGVFMLSGGYSTGAASYMQTIFRGQTPYKNGAIKSNCYAFDFAPDRTLTVIDDYIKMQPTSSNGRNRTHGDRVKTVEEHLKFCPVISMKGSEEVKYDALTFVKKVNQAYSEHIISNGFKSRYLFKNMAMFTQADHDLLATVDKMIGGA
ncbi:MAG: DEAD/DEAH box helicase, partial [Bacteroidales bacterium]|nr:DEAD/DEAH box helicase [Bacteroidales bacterium]